VDLHRDAHPASVASGASTLLQPLGPSRLAIYWGTRRPTLPAIISICVAIGVEAARSSSYSGYLDLVASLEAWNGKADQRRTIGSASPLESIRRLIQRLVRPVTCHELLRFRHPHRESGSQGQVPSRFPRLTLAVSAVSRTSFDRKQ
jgi:hypothetical protein